MPRQKYKKRHCQIFIIPPHGVMTLGAISPRIWFAYRISYDMFTVRTRGISFDIHGIHYGYRNIAPRLWSEFKFK